jgi:hypothetical protein
VRSSTPKRASGPSDVADSIDGRLIEVCDEDGCAAMEGAEQEAQMGRGGRLQAADSLR